MSGTLSEGSSDLEYVCLENGDYNLELDVADDDGAEGDDASADDGTGDDDTSAGDDGNDESCATLIGSIGGSHGECVTASDDDSFAACYVQIADGAAGDAGCSNGYLGGFPGTADATACYASCDRLRQCISSSCTRPRIPCAAAAPAGCERRRRDDPTWCHERASPTTTRAEGVTRRSQRLMVWCTPIRRLRCLHPSARAASRSTSSS